MSKITETAQAVLEKRYFIEGEEEWGDLVNRVASTFATTHDECVDFSKTLMAMDFLPNSPALMNAGTAINAYSACYVLPVEDSIESIYKFYSDAAIISKSGGGVGANYSAIRSVDSTVNSTGGVASGPLSFMKVQDVSTDIIKQGGRRRGANMGIINCDHEDIWKFVGAKDTAGSLENFNLSVGITDEFMRGVLEDEEWNRVKLWNELIQRAWSSAEPGVLFLDTIEAGNTVPHLGRLEATNPCGEQPLLPYESCTLGSINLSNMVTSMSYSESGLVRDGVKYKVDWDKLKETTRTAVLFLNRILDKSEMPIPECQEAMEKTRKIGLGIMGLHDMLIQLGLPYDSEEGRSLAGSVMKFIAEEADEFSTELANKEGAYGGWVESPTDTISYEMPYRRNACLTTIAPTGTLSMIADCSSGCEPYYAPVTYKTVLDGTEFAMYNKWVAIEADWEDEDPEMTLMREYDLFKGAGEIHWRDHVLMQAELQKYVDSSISKTINMPNDATVEDVREAYELAYETGCKGITVYRDGSRGEQVLSSSSSKVTDGGDGGGDKEGKGDEDEQRIHTMSGVSQAQLKKADLPTVLDAKRYMVRVDKQKVYILVAEDSSGAPREVFVKFPYESTDNCWNIVCRQVSLSMRYGIPLAEIVKQLEKSVATINDTASHLARILKMYMQSKGTSLEMPLCPDCGGASLTFTEGCEKCIKCGWSKCG